MANDLEMFFLRIVYTQMPYEKQSKQSGIFSCENCSFNTDKRQNYISHLDTRKHKILLNPSNHPTEKESFSCVCGKEYKHRQTLYAHKKKCSQLREDNTRDKPVPEHEPTKEIVTVLLEQNTMFQELILKNEEQQRKSEEDKNDLLRINQELLRINQEEKNELLRRNQEQQSQMMDLQKQFLEAIKKSLQQ